MSSRGERDAVHRLPPSFLPLVSCVALRPSQQVLVEPDVAFSLVSKRPCCHGCCSVFIGFSLDIAILGFKNDVHVVLINGIDIAFNLGDRAIDWLYERHRSSWALADLHPV